MYMPSLATVSEHDNFDMSCHERGGPYSPWHDHQYVFHDMFIMLFQEYTMIM